MEEIRGAKRFYGWPEDANFLVPDEVYAALPLPGSAPAAARCARTGTSCSRGTGRTTRTWPTSWTGCSCAPCPTDWDADIPAFPADPKGLAGREANGTVLNAVGARVPWLVGGSADLAPSTKTLHDLRGGRGLLGRRPGWAQPALRGA